jgi:hypothetical protein
MLLPPLTKTAALMAVLFQLFSCAGLKPAQLKAIEQYTVATRDISRIPPDIYFRIYQLRSQAQTIQLSALITTNESVKESIDLLQLDFNDKMKFIELVDSFSYAYKIVEKYADLVHALMSESYLKEFNKNKKEWQGSFDGLVTKYNAASARRIPPPTPIPASVGSVAASIIREIGSMKIKSLQKKYLKNAISTARIPFEGICDDFLNNDIPKVQKELTELRFFIDENYKDFLNNIRAFERKQGDNPFNYYKFYLPVYAQWQLQIKEVETLVYQLSIAFRSLRNGYGVLETLISSKEIGENFPVELKKLNVDYSSLMETIDKFTEAREKLFNMSY